MKTWYIASYVRQHESKCPRNPNNYVLIFSVANKKKIIAHIKDAIIEDLQHYEKKVGYEVPEVVELSNDGKKRDVTEEYRFKVASRLRTKRVSAFTQNYDDEPLIGIFPEDGASITPSH